MGAGGGTQASFTGAVTANSISASTINGLGDPLAFSSSVATQFANITGSGTINTGSFATTGSNTFNGNQTISGSFTTNGGITIGNTSAQYNSSNIVTSKTNFPGNVYNAYNINTDGDGQWSAGLYVSTYNGFGSEPAAGLYGGGLGNGGTNNILESYGNLVRVNKNTEISGSLAVSASLTVNGSPVVTSAQTASFAVNTGSFATTGSNYFVGDQTIADTTGNTVAFQSYSGSLVLTGKTIASGSSTLSNYTSSANQLNLIFKASSTTSDTVISGSNNIIANPNANTAGFRRYFTTGNIGLVASGLPQFSASMGFSPTLSGNYFANTNTFGMTVRGPVSSSAWNITNNGIFGGAVNLGTAAATNYERAINGTIISNNILNGATVNVTAYKTAFTNTSAMTIASNIIGGTLSLNADSSSLTIAVSFYYSY
jgi:hypothetical protein